MGVYPESFMAPMRDDVGRLLTRIERATPASDSAPTPGKPAAKAGGHGEPSASHSMPAEAH